MSAQEVLNTARLQRDVLQSEAEVLRRALAQVRLPLLSPRCLGPQAIPRAPKLSGGLLGPWPVGTGLPSLSAGHTFSQGAPPPSVALSPLLAAALYPGATVCPRGLTTVGPLPPGPTQSAGSHTSVMRGSLPPRR